jgi:hypothetical protein
VPGTTLTFRHALASVSVISLPLVQGNKHALPLPGGCSSRRLRAAASPRRHAADLHQPGRRLGGVQFHRPGDANYTIQTSSGLQSDVSQVAGEISTRINDPALAPSIGYIAKFELVPVFPWSGF